VNEKLLLIKQIIEEESSKNKKPLTWYGDRFDFLYDKEVLFLKTFLKIKMKNNI
jgi:hypothetical protein